MFKVHPVAESEKVAILEFSQAHAWRPAHPKTLVKRFLCELISSNEMIFDLHDDQGRAICAVMLDRVRNPANDACLEILGLRSGVEPAAAVDAILKLAQKHLPQARSGFQMGLAENSGVSPEHLRNRGMVECYATFEMENPSIESSPLDVDDKITVAAKADCKDVYRVLCEAFKQNLDTSIPDFEAYEKGFLNSDKMHIYLWKEQGELVGYATLFEHEQECEVRVVGVMPSHRGTGIGRSFIRHCLNETKRLGFEKCHLTVAVENERALGLYLRSGFQVLERHRCFRLPIR